MGKKLFINNKHNSFKKTVSIDGDKSISIRTLLLGSQAYGKTSIENILLSEDIINAIKCLRKLGTRISLDKNKLINFDVSKQNSKDMSKIQDENLKSINVFIKRTYNQINLN